MKISVGPAPFNWGEEKLIDFYREIADCPADDVYIGEIACAQRSSLSPKVVRRIGAELEEAGKAVYLSSPILVTSAQERRDFDLLSQSMIRVEINSPAFLSSARSHHAVAGIFLNVYNSATARMLAGMGMNRVVLPLELGRTALPNIVQCAGLGVEVIVHGHVPVAFSRNCYTARALLRNSRNCGAACKDYPDGMVLAADKQALFRVDGPLTLSGSSYCLLEYLPWLERIGVECIRIQPQAEHTGRIIRLYSNALQRRADSVISHDLRELATMSSQGLCNGTFLRKAGWLYESPN